LKPPAHVVLGRILIKVWSALLNLHSFHLYLNPLKHIVDGSANKSPSNFSEIKDKIWTLRYTSLGEFKKDVEYALRSDSKKPGNETQSEAFANFNLLFNQYVRPYEEQLKEIEQRQKRWPPSEINKIVEEKNLLLSKTLYSFAPYKLKEVKVETQQKRNEEWAMRITDSNNIAMTENEGPDEAIGVLASLAQAAISSGSSGNDSNSGGEARQRQNSKCRGHNLDFVPFSNEEIQNMIAKQASVLQKGLVNLAKLKKAVAINSTAVQESQGGSGSNPQVLTLGEMRTAAEYRVANNMLKSQLAEMKKMLDVERQARMAAEEMVRNLKKRLQMLASTANILYTGTKTID